MCSILLHRFHEKTSTASNVVMLVSLACPSNTTHGNNLGVEGAGHLAPAGGVVGIRTAGRFYLTLLQRGANTTCLFMSFHGNPLCVPFHCHGLSWYFIGLLWYRHGLPWQRHGSEWHRHARFIFHGVHSMLHWYGRSCPGRYIMAMPRKPTTGKPMTPPWKTRRCALFLQGIGRLQRSR